MSLFRRKVATTAKEEPSLLDIDDSVNAVEPPASTVTKRASFLGSWTKKSESTNAVPSQNVISPQSRLSSVQPPKSVSPRISTSSRTSVFERSVDTAHPQYNTPSSAATQFNSSLNTRMVDPSHSQLVVDNQIPSVLDASVEAIVNNEDLDRVEIVTAQPCLTADTIPMPTLPNPWLEENIATGQIPIGTGVSGANKRLSFVSYADLLGVEQAEAEAASLYSQRSTSPRPLSPENPGSNTQQLPSPLRPSSAPVDALARRAKSVVTLSTPSDLELTRTSMADTIMQPSLAAETDANPWT